MNIIPADQRKPIAYPEAKAALQFCASCSLSTRPVDATTCALCGKLYSH